jgi:hypothetical protein
VGAKDHRSLAAKLQLSHFLRTHNNNLMSLANHCSHLGSSFFAGSHECVPMASLEDEDPLVDLRENEDPYGFLARAHSEEESESQALIASRQKRERPAQPPTSSTQPTDESNAKRVHAGPHDNALDHMLCPCARKLVNLSMLPLERFMAGTSFAANQQFFYHGYPELYKLVLHLRQAVGAYECWGDVVNMPGGKFMNSVSDMERIALTRNFSYKWGATEDLCRRCYELELLKSYSQVLWHPRSSTAEVASLEQALIEHYTSDKVPFQVRGRCDNRPNPKWGEGLRKDASPSFLYLAIRR